MLQLRPNCECCDKDLPANSPDALICSYECTFCAQCATKLLHNVCPNCGGGFSPRPIRPATSYRPGVGLDHQQSSTLRVHSPYSEQEMQDFSLEISSIPPEQR